MSLNMKKEIRAELRTLKKVLAKVGRDQFNANRAWNNLERAAIKLCKQTRKQIHRECMAGNRRANREAAKINRRILILKGRLS